MECGLTFVSRFVLSICAHETLSYSEPHACEIISCLIFRDLRRRKSGTSLQNIFSRAEYRVLIFLNSLYSSLFRVSEKQVVIVFFTFLKPKRKAEMTRNETQKIESLITSGRQKLDKLIAGALNGDPADGVGDIGEGIGEATTELRRLWEDGKEQLTALAGTGGEVCVRCAQGTLGTLGTP